MSNRVWTYVIGKNLSETEINDLLSDGKKFVSEWTAHENKLEASFKIISDRIILVRVNEDVNSASGCSIDKLTRFMKEAGAHYGFDPFNRYLVAIKKPDSIYVVHSSQVKGELEKGNITSDTIVFNTAVLNETELEQWEQPLKNTWLSKYL